jgi:tetratricopeptide (TPR) repeat protein
MPHRFLLSSSIAGIMATLLSGLAISLFCVPARETDAHQKATAGTEWLSALAGQKAPESFVALLLEKNWAAAEAKLRERSASSPDKAETANLRGVLSFLEGRLPDAEQSFRQALAQNSSFSVARRNLGITLWHEHHASEAAQILKRAHADNPDDPLGNLYLGQVAFAAHDCVSAVQSFNRSGNAVFWMPAATFMDVVCEARLGNADKAAELLVQIAREPRLPPQDVFQLALQAEKAEQFRLAYQVLKRLPEDYPDPYTYAYDTALAAYQNKDYDPAIALLRKLQVDGKDTPDTSNLLGNVLEDKGIRQKKPPLVQEAYDSYRRGIYKDPHYLANFIDIGRLAFKLANYDLGEQLLTEGLKQNPDSYQLVLERGIGYAFSDHADRAAVDFTRAKQLAPGSPMPYMAEGILNIQQGKYPEAITALEEGVKRSSKPNAWLYYLLARSIHKDGRHTPEREARLREALLETIRLDPNFSDAYGLAGLVWMRAHEYDRAVSFLETAHRLDPENSHYVYELAMTKRLQGDPTSAAKYVKDFQQLEAKNNPSRMRKYLWRILVDQQTTPALQETDNTERGR